MEESSPPAVHSMMLAYDVPPVGTTNDQLVSSENSEMPSAADDLSAEASVRGNPQLLRTVPCADVGCADQHVPE